MSSPNLPPPPPPIRNTKQQISVPASPSKESTKVAARIMLAFANDKSNSVKSAIKQLSVKDAKDNTAGTAPKNNVKSGISTNVKHKPPSLSSSHFNSSDGGDDKPTLTNSTSIPSPSLLSRARTPPKTSQSFQSHLSPRNVRVSTPTYASSHSVSSSISSTSSGATAVEYAKLLLLRQDALAIIKRIGNTLADPKQEGAGTGTGAQQQQLTSTSSESKSQKESNFAGVTVDELKTLEECISAITISGDEQLFDLDATLSAAKNGSSGYLLDDDGELYKSLKSFMTVRLERPGDKFKRVARSVKDFKARIRALSPRNDSSSTTPSFVRQDSDFADSAQDQDQDLTEILPEQYKTSVLLWSFNIFTLDSEADGTLLHDGSLVWVAETCIRKCGVLGELRVNNVFLKGWLKKVSEGYNDVPYHNHMHSADVVQTMYCFLSSSPELQQTLEAKTKFVALLAAASHDIGHSGVNNTFLINTGDPLATTYHYESPLEHMHCAKTFEVMRLPGCDVLSFFDGEQLKECRQMIVSFILATDMEGHFRHVAELAKRTSTIGINLSSPPDLFLTIGLLLHAADVSNPAKKWKYYQQWTDRVMSEFYAQGDSERKLDMRVTDGYDRTNPTPASKFQNGFMAFIVKPLYEELNKLKQVDLSIPLLQIDDNLSSWKRISDANKAANRVNGIIEPHSPLFVCAVSQRRSEEAEALSKLTLLKLETKEKEEEEGVEEVGSDCDDSGDGCGDLV